MLTNVLDHRSRLDDLRTIAIVVFELVVVVVVDVVVLESVIVVVVLQNRPWKGRVLSRIWSLHSI